MNSRVYFKYENVLYGIYIKVNRNISEREYIFKTVTILFIYIIDS
ncbi:hypothetical protein BT246_24940 [Bacillus thuringiensis]|uniref:Uncharacterized protein n=1 Tax=Bacillus thuringiensis TaxID=1428 RepID=A0A9W3SB80_BACTU|nr:hypothetical protein BT246_24940 [Bacillus thuringiensis]